MAGDLHFGLSPRLATFGLCPVQLAFPRCTLGPRVDLRQRKVLLLVAC